jgi:hypothetical protein
VEPGVQVRQLWLLLCVPLTLIDTSNHKSQPFSAVLSMETKPERHHRHDHVHEEAREGEDDAVAMEHGALPLQRGGATLFGWRQDEEEEAGRRRVEIREMDFFSRDSRARSHDDAGGGRGDVNVSTPRSRSSSAAVLARRLLRIDAVTFKFIGCSGCCADRATPADHDK